MDSVSTMAEYGKPPTKNMPQQGIWLQLTVIVASFVALMLLLSRCNGDKTVSRLEGTKKEEIAINKESASRLLAIECMLSGTEQNVLEGMTKKQVSRKDIFILDPDKSILFNSDYSPSQDAKVFPDRIVVEKKDEDVNEIDGTGSIYEYLYFISRKDLSAQHTVKNTSNTVGIRNTSYVLMEGSCRRVPLPPKSSKQAKTMI